MSIDLQVPVLLLKTRSQPHDAYEEHFLFPPTQSTPDLTPRLRFQPEFIPVLEHKQNEETLSALGALLGRGRLREKYGGMIFTSQRAVEGWADIVTKVEEDGAAEGLESDLNTALDTRTGQTFQTDILPSTPFPLYTVGPATSRGLDALVHSSSALKSTTFARLNPCTLGAHTGNGATLATYIQGHYNALHAHAWYTYYEAPRLPFIPLLGMGSENYSRRRLEGDDPRLRKRPLLFLVGEQRRDIIPRTLMGADVDPQIRIEVDEVEVYSTVVADGFRRAFEDCARKADASSPHGSTSVVVVVVVVFSPQGTREMLTTLGLIDPQGRVTEYGEKRWETPWSDPPASPFPNSRHLLVTIGPTTRDHLIDRFGVRPDVCAAKPSPEGVGEGVRAFLAAKGVVPVDVGSAN